MSRTEHVIVKTSKTYRNYAEFLYFEVPMFLDQVLTSFGLKHRDELYGNRWGSGWSEYVEAPERNSGFRARWKPIATFCTVPGFEAKGGFGTHDALRIRVINALYIGAIQELARRFEKAFGLRAEVTYSTGET